MTKIRTAPAESHGACYSTLRHCLQTTLRMKPTKAEIISVAVASQRGIIHDLEKRTHDLLTAGDADEQNHKTIKQSRDSALIADVKMINHELRFVKDELKELERLKRRSVNSASVAPGAVVATNHGLYFASVSIGGFNVGRSHFFGLSIRSPLYKKMKGMRAGEKFKFRNEQYEITDIY